MKTNYFRHGRVVTAFPTSGKSHFAIHLIQEGVPVMDMDVLTSVFCPVYFKAKLPYVSDKVFDNLVRALYTPSAMLAARMWLDKHPDGILLNNVTNLSFLSIMFGEVVTGLPLYFLPESEDALTHRLILRMGKDESKTPDAVKSYVEKNLSWYRGARRSIASIAKVVVEIPQDGGILEYYTGIKADRIFTKVEMEGMISGLYKQAREIVGDLPPRFLEAGLDHRGIIDWLQSHDLYPKGFKIQ